MLDIVVPPDAFLHEVALDYVSDLWITVDIGSRRESVGPLYLAWFDEGASFQIVSSVEPPEWAANGVTLQALREGVPAGVRQMPPRLQRSGVAREAHALARPATVAPDASSLPDGDTGLQP
jgi:hypothetical protein